MDLSDGLVGDLPKLAHASGLAAHVAVERLPLSEAMRAAVASCGAGARLGAGGGRRLRIAARGAAGTALPNSRQAAAD
jgi:thiamine-monophosphate kinase